MPFVATQKSEQNRRLLDPWTAVHLSAGLAAGLVDVPLRWALPAAVAYEVAEQVFERYEAGQAFFKTSGPEVVANAVADAVVFAFGHWLGQTWNGS